MAKTKYFFRHVISRWNFEPKSLMRLVNQKSKRYIDARFGQILEICFNVDIINFVRIGMTVTHRRHRID